MCLGDSVNLTRELKKGKHKKNGRPDERTHTGELEFSMLNIYFQIRLLLLVTMFFPALLNTQE